MNDYSSYGYNPSASDEPDEILTHSGLEELRDWDRRFQAGIEGKPQDLKLEDSGVRGFKGSVFNGVSEKNIELMASHFRNLYLPGGSYQHHAQPWTKPYLEYYAPEEAPYLNYGRSKCGHHRCWCADDLEYGLIEAPVFGDALDFPRLRINYLEKRMDLSFERNDGVDWSWADAEIQNLKQDLKDKIKRSHRNLSLVRFDPFQLI